MRCGLGGLEEAQNPADDGFPGAGKGEGIPGRRNDVYVQGAEGVRGQRVCNVLVRSLQI